MISGPYIEDGRWIVELPRKTTDAAALLKEKLADGGKNAGVADLIAKAIQKNLKVLVNSEVLEVYEENEDFAEFLTDFLLGKPFWLKNLDKAGILPLIQSVLLCYGVVPADDVFGQVKSSFAEPFRKLNWNGLRT